MGSNTSKLAGYVPSVAVKGVNLMSMQSGYYYITYVTKTPTSGASEYIRFLVKSPDRSVVNIYSLTEYDKFNRKDLLEDNRSLFYYYIEPNGFGYLCDSENDRDNIYSLEGDGLLHKRRKTNVPNDRFLLTIDGKIYSFAMATCLDPATPKGSYTRFISGSCSQNNFAWKISEFIIPNKILPYSLWKPPMVNAPNFAFGDPCLHSGCKSGWKCPTNYASIGTDSRNVANNNVCFFTQDTVCRRNAWDEMNKDACCSSSKFMNGSSIDYNVCAMDNPKTNYRACYAGGKHEKKYEVGKHSVRKPNGAGDWYPWSESCNDTESVKRFCSQVDTTKSVENSRALYDINESCKAWKSTQDTASAKLGKNFLPDLQSTYCTKNPYDRICAQVCTASGNYVPSCNNSMRDFCIGRNLETDTCIEFCNKDQNDCNQALSDYCKGLDSKTAANLPKNICGCFMKQEVYDSFFTKFDVVLPGVAKAISTIQRSPDCWYPKCLSAEVKRKGRPQCASSMTCIQNLQINVDNNSQVGIVNPQQTMDCVIKELPKCDGNDVAENGRCVTCPHGKMPDQNRINCIDKICPIGKSLDANNNCVDIVCPTGKILNGNNCIDITCPIGKRLDGNNCIDITCPIGKRLDGNNCIDITCPIGKRLDGNNCVDIVCETGKQLVGNDCIDIVCPIGKRLDGNNCIDIVCPVGKRLEGNNCVDIVCETGKRLDGNNCVDIVCPIGTRLDGNNCVDIVCPIGKRLDGNNCVDIICNIDQYLDGSECKTCGSNQIVVDNACVDCPATQYPATDRKSCLPCYGGDVINGVCVPCAEGKFIALDGTCTDKCRWDQIPVDKVCVQCPPSYRNSGGICRWYPPLILNDASGNVIFSMNPEEVTIGKLTMNRNVFIVSIVLIIVFIIVILYFVFRKKTPSKVI